MELKLEHVLLFLLFVSLFQMIIHKCNRLTEGFGFLFFDFDSVNPYGTSCSSPANCDYWKNVLVCGRKNSDDPVNKCWNERDVPTNLKV